MSHGSTTPIVSRANGIAVLIATRDRDELLRSRSLPSVARRTRTPDYLVVVNDGAPLEPRLHPLGKLSPELRAAVFLVAGIGTVTRCTQFEELANAHTEPATSLPGCPPQFRATRSQPKMRLWAPIARAMIADQVGRTQLQPITLDRTSHPPRGSKPPPWLGLVSLPRMLPRPQNHDYRSPSRPRPTPRARRLRRDVPR
jgi:hypothetical protein